MLLICVNTAMLSTCENGRYHAYSSHFPPQFFMLLIFVNTAMLALEYNNQPESLTKFQEDTNYVLTALFTMEMILKLYGLGFWDYVRVSLLPTNDLDNLFYNLENLLGLRAGKQKKQQAATNSCG